MSHTRSMSPPRTSSTRHGRYGLASEGRTLHRRASSRELVAELADRHPIVSVEDALAEDDWDGWAAFTERLGGADADSG